MTATMTPVEYVHRQATVASVNELATRLQEVLSRRLTAFTVGVQDSKTVARWAASEVVDIRDDEVERRLRVAYEITQLLGAEAPATVRAWFIGLNPHLGDVAPAEAIREGRLADALAAARAFVVGG